MPVHWTSARLGFLPSFVVESLCRFWRGSGGCGLCGRRGGTGPHACGPQMRCLRGGEFHRLSVPMLGSAASIGRSAVSPPAARCPRVSPRPTLVTESVRTRPRHDLATAPGIPHFWAARIGSPHCAKPTAPTNRSPQKTCTNTPSRDGKRASAVPQDANGDPSVSGAELRGLGRARDDDGERWRGALRPHPRRARPHNPPFNGKTMVQSPRAHARGRARVLPRRKTPAYGTADAERTLGLGSS
jgi:hypothetical protein